MRYLKWSFLAYDTVFVPRGRVHTQISFNVGDLSMVVPYERTADSGQRTQDENNRLVAIAGHLSALRLPLMVTLILHGAVFVRCASCATG